MFVALTVLFVSPAFAAGQEVTVNVNGLVCDFCARAIEKVFGKKDEISAVKVDLDQKIIALNFKDGQNIDDETITKLVTDAGYNVVSIARSQVPSGNK